MGEAKMENDDKKRVEELVSITSRIGTQEGGSRECAPEAHAIADELNECGVQAYTPMTGDHVVYVKRQELNLTEWRTVSRFLTQSHYTEGKPRTATPAKDGFVAVKPFDTKHPDGPRW